MLFTVHIPSGRDSVPLLRSENHAIRDTEIRRNRLAWVVTRGKTDESTHQVSLRKARPGSKPEILQAIVSGEIDAYVGYSNSMILVRENAAQELRPFLYPGIEANGTFSVRPNPGFVVIYQSSSEIPGLASKTI